jgi:hypothetical protein
MCDDLSTSSSSDRLLQQVEQRFSTFCKVSKTSSKRNAEKVKKDKKKLLKTHGKTLLTLLERTLPGGKNDKHLASAVHVATKLYELKSVLPNKHMALVTEHLYRGVSTLPVHSPSCCSNDNKNNTTSPPSFHLQLQLHKIYLRFLQAACSKPGNQAQKMLLIKLLQFCRKVSCKVTAFKSQKDTTIVNQLLCDHCVEIVKYAGTCNARINTENADVENCQSSNQGNSSGSSSGKRKRTCEYFPRQHPLMLLMDDLCFRSSNSEISDWSIKILMSHARKSSTPSTTATNTSTTTSSTTDKEVFFWSSELPILWSKVVELRYYLTTTLKSTTAASKDADNEVVQKMVASLDRSFGRVLKSKKDMIVQQQSFFNDQILQTIRKITFHIYSLHTFVIAFIKSKHTSIVPVTVVHALSLCWKRVRSIAAVFLDMKETNSANSDSNNILNDICCKIINRSMELAVVCCNDDILNVAKMNAALLLSDDTVSALKTNSSIGSCSSSTGNAALLKRLSNTIYLGARELNQNRQHKKAAEVALLSCMVAEHWLTIKNEANQESQEIQEMRYVTMNRYQLLSDCCHYSNDFDKALVYSIRSLELCDRLVDIKSKVVRVVKREIHFVRNSNMRRKKKKKKKKNQKDSSDKDDGSERDTRQVPWATLMSTRKYARKVCLHAAASYRFVYREHLPDASNGDIIALSILQRCQYGHQIVTASYTSDCVLMLEKVRFHREECAFLQQDTNKNET